MKIKGFVFILVLFFVSVNFVFGVQAQDATRRFGIFIGANNGGRERTMLRYAVTDARSIKDVFAEMGGIAAEDSIILVEPSVRDINRSLDAIHSQILRARGVNRRTEIIFYYSGHSDEEGLLLNREKYTYRELRDRINNIPADMRIVILDSCASGAFTRLKGGERTQPFLVDGSFTAEGHAFLTSSSANEASQESDRIAASFFTHSLVAGLRGAADFVGDGRVTLNELYRFAYAETLARTETSLFGAQHPSYDIQISGTGDLVLTDISRTSAGIVFEENLTGRLSIRNSRNHLIVEITKTVRPLELGLEPGLYHITLQQGNDLLRAEVTLTEGSRTVVTRDNFYRIQPEQTRRRGDDVAEALPKTTLYTFFFNVAHEPFRFPLIGFVNFGIGNHSSLQTGFLNWNTKDFKGLQAGFVNTVGGDFRGLQGGFINTNIGNTKGLQAGFINTSIGEIRGIQSGFVNTSVEEMIGTQFGFVNVAAKGIKGSQFGFINYAESVDGVPIGFISIVKNGGYRAIEYSLSEFFAYNIGFKTGVERFYTSFYIAHDQFDMTNSTWDNFAVGIGFGTIIPIGKLFYFNLELNTLTSIKLDAASVNFVSLVPHFGVNIGRFSIAAGPSVTWAHTYDVERSRSDRKNSELPVPNFSLRTFDINDFHKIAIGARVAARFRF